MVTSSSIAILLSVTCSGRQGELQPGEPHYAILGDCNFSGPIASGATLSDADLDGADFSGANLNRTNLRLANFLVRAGIVNLAMFGRRRQRCPTRWFSSMVIRTRAPLGHPGVRFCAPGSASTTRIYALAPTSR